MRSRRRESPRSFWRRARAPKRSFSSCPERPGLSKPSKESHGRRWGRPLDWRSPNQETSMPIDTGISAKDRVAIAQGLSRLLADTYMLYLKTHGFNWNVEGPMFQTLHQMFMAQYTETWNAIDPIAERIRALGHYAPGSYRQYAKLATVKESEGVPKAEKMIRELIEGQEAVARTARSVLPLADDANDQPTLDLLTQRLDIHEKNAWMLRSLLKK